MFQVHISHGVKSLLKNLAEAEKKKRSQRKKNTECSKISTEAVCKCCKVHSEMAQQKSIEAAGCDGCAKYAEHVQRKIESRQCYEEDKILSEKSTDGKTCFCSLDLQKVTMLPEIAGVKSAVFTQRICAYNESFSSVGKRKGKSIAMLWHQGVAGRNDEDIASCFEKFILYEVDHDNKHLACGWITADPKTKIGHCTLL